MSTSLDQADETARGYHHGDLREALVAAGLTALETTDIADISLRGLARDVGVSATAVYRHFPDKRALMTALASEGLERLGLYQQRAASAAGEGAFAETGRAYVRFALAHPALFRLVFTHSECGTADLSDDSIASQMLRSNAAQEAGGDPLITQRIGVQAWALVHGLAMLMLDGQLPADDALIDRIIDGRTLFGAGERDS